MKLILIRHGETVYTCKKRLCGAINTPLNDTGVKQAQKLAKLLKRRKIDIVYASPMRRTVQTANIIFSRRPITIKKNTLLRETYLGKWEGLTMAEIEKQFPQDVKRWYKEPMTFGAPGGEDLVTLQSRVKRFLKRIWNAHKNDNNVKTVAIVSHSGPIRIILGEISGQGLKGFWESEPKTGQYQVIKLNIQV
jgi:phosphoserine phosphatase